MDPRLRHAHLQEMLLRARTLQGGERRQYLEKACGGDAELRREIDRLLEHDAKPSPRIEAPFGDAHGRHALRAELEALLEGPPKPPPANAVLPRTIGAFRICGKLGEGGMGAVYEAEQERPRRRVALKVLRPALLSADSLRRFERESEFLARLQHPGIAQIFDSGTAETEAGPQPYFAMELVRGEPLTDYARRRGLTVRERLELFAHVAEAVQHAHGQGVIHRDLKPANILVDASGRPRVLDFGIARATDPDAWLTAHTNAGEILGTLAYMSPEQASGDPRAVDARSDVYSLGVLLFELLTGELPYDVSSKLLAHAVRTIQEEEPRRLRTLRGDLGADVETIACKALEKDKERRYPSVEALSDDVRRFLRHEPIQARPPSRLYTLGKFVHRNKAFVGAVATTFVVLLLALVVSLRFGFREAAARRLLERDQYEQYVSRAQEALDEGRVADARRFLEHAPARLRGWEWHHLDQRSAPELATVTIPGVELAAFLDESRILAVHDASSVCVWDALSGERTPSRTWPPGGGRALALSADGRRLLSHRDGALLLGDPTGDDPPTILPFEGRAPSSRPGTSAVSAEGTRVAVATEDEEVIVLDVAGGARILPSDGWKVLAVTFAPGSRVVVKTTSGFRVWSTEGPDPRPFLPRYGAVAFAPDGGTMVMESDGVNGVGARLVLEDCERGEQVATFVRGDYGVHHFFPCQAASFSPDGRHLALVFGGENFFLGLQDPANGGLTEPQDLARHVGVFLHPGDVRVAFSPSGAGALSVGLTDSTIRLWRVDAPADGRVLHAHGSYVYTVAFSPDGATLASGAWDRCVYLWDSASGERIARWSLGDVNDGAHSQVYALAFSPDGRRIARMSGGWLDLLDAARGLVVAPRLAEGPGDAVAYSPDGSFLVGDTRGRTRLWDARTLEEIELASDLATHPKPSFAIDATSTLLATGSGGSGRLTLSELATGIELASINGDGRRGSGYFSGANSLAFTPGGDRLVVAWGGSAITVLDVPSLSVVAVLEGHVGEVYAVAVSPDGTRIASGGKDGFLRLWDAETGAPLLKLAGHHDYVKCVAFSPDGRQIATGSGDETVRIWDSAPAAELWREFAASERAKPAAEALVDGLYEECSGSSAAVVERIEREVVDPSARRLALRAFLRRELDARAGG